MVLLAALVIGCAFVMTEHYYLTGSRNEDISVQTDDILASAAEGSPVRRAGFALIALLGVVCLAQTSRQPFRLHGLLPLCLLFYLAWCLASTAWASDPSLTIRRLGALVCCAIGVVGVARQLSLRQLCLASLGITATYVLIGLLFELRLGVFTPWNGVYRFAGTVHPNLQASYCAVLCLAAICLASRQTTVRPLFICLAVLGGGLLLLTKSRTTTMAALVALTALGWIRSSGRQRIVAGLLFGGLAAALFLAMFLGCIGWEGNLLDAMLMGHPKTRIRSPGEFLCGSN